MVQKLNELPWEGEKFASMVANAAVVSTASSSPRHEIEARFVDVQAHRSKGPQQDLQTSHLDQPTMIPALPSPEKITDNNHFGEFDEVYSQ